MINEEKKISVIIPIYNTEKYLADCINSVLNQTYENFELLLIDDGSSDNSPQICDDFAKKDDRIKVIHKQNGGVASARNIGIDNATGDYIAFLDSDDWWNKDFLSEMIKEKEKYNLSICKLIKCTPDGNKKADPKYRCDMSQWCWPIIFNQHITCWRCIFNADIIKNNNIKFTLNRKTGEDQEFIYKYMMHINTISYIPTAEYYYRINPASVMFTANYNHFQAVDAMKSVEEYAKKICSEERYKLISNALRNYKYPYILDFAIQTVITSGDKPKKVIEFLKEKGYYDLLNNACRSEKHYESQFIKLWSVSPMLCLNYIYVRKTFGKLLRKITGKS